jgi:hypothetical protein
MLYKSKLFFNITFQIGQIFYEIINIFNNIRIRESNIKRFKDAFVKALEAVHLLDEEIKLRIRYKHIF